MKESFLFLVLAMTFTPSLADEYTDPATNVVYSYKPGCGVAQVKAGARIMTDAYHTEYVSGSPEAKGEITILGRFTADGQEYIVNSVGENAFTHNKEITSVAFPSAVRDVYDYAFEECSSLTSVLFPDSLKSIGMRAFTGSGLSSLEFPEGLEFVGVAAFSHCSRLKSVRIPSTLGYIYDTTFIFCDSLETITVDKDNYRIDSRDDCNAVINKAYDMLEIGCGGTVIPSTVKIIGERAFYCCTSLNGEAVIPEPVEIIASEAFRNCTGMTHVTLPQSLHIIGPGAFARTGLKSVTIPSGVTSVMGLAFGDIPSLISITSLIEKPFPLAVPICDEAKCSTITLYVPMGTKENYMATEGWNKFKNIVEMDKVSVDVAVSNTDSMPFSAYDLYGHRLTDTPHKGVYIRGGRKYMK